MPDPVPSLSAGQALASEAEAVQARYARRVPNDPRYSVFSPAALWAWQERQRATLALLARHGWSDLAECRMLEVGSGTGDNLLDWLRWGGQPAHLAGIELLLERHQQARERLPSGVMLEHGDACDILEAQAGDSDAAGFDIILQATVFSSLLDDAVQQRLAQAMWSRLKPGGAILWYDFTVDNPRNPDVRGVPLERVRDLFRLGSVAAQRLTLAPPLARGVGRASVVHAALSALPFLRTHLLAWIVRPGFLP